MDSHQTCLCPEAPEPAFGLIARMTSRRGGRYGFQGPDLEDARQEAHLEVRIALGPDYLGRIARALATEDFRRTQEYDEVRLAIGRVIDRLRRQRDRSPGQLDYDPVSQGEGGPDLIDRALDIADALMGLGQREREIYRLRVRERLGYREIAERLDIEKTRAQELMMNVIVPHLARRLRE